MPVLDVNSLFTRAEGAFAAGQLDQARADLVDVQRLAGDHPAVLHLLALVEKKRGDTAAARDAFERALRLAPGDAQINNNYANLLNALGERDAALHHFGKALAVEPKYADARYNRALLLEGLGRLEEAISELDELAVRPPVSAKLHSARANMLRRLRRLDEAAEAYDAALRIEPKRLTALHGRARVAIERGEPSAPALYRRALAAKPDDLALQLGLAEALEAEGDTTALDNLAVAVSAAPEWADGQAALARMRWEAGEGRAFTRDLEHALEKCPGSRGLWLAYVFALAAVDLCNEAADAAAIARKEIWEDPEFQLLEAIHASEAGEIGRAERLFADLPPDLTGRSLHEVRHRIRTGEFGRALALTDAARVESQWDVVAWAMSGLLWRIAGDDRAEWLHGQPGLVTTQDLDLSQAELSDIADRLRNLHRTRAHPIGQSLRGGTQTRGRLFGRKEPEVRRLRDAAFEAVQRYWNALPPPDPSHPLLRHRDRSPRFDGSWSVRLTNGGFHVVHVHPNGLLSSACYLAVPEAQRPREGWLEIGGAPAGLGLELEPQAQVEPVPGRLALFPSTLYHGTRPFAAGERLTAAFDVIAA